MSRSGYTEDCDSEWAMICWRGAVASAIRGRRGQAFLKEMLQALDALPERRLVAHELEEDSVGDGGTIVTEQVCALGAVGLVRKLDMSDIDPENYSAIARLFGVAPALVREIEYVNDEDYSRYWEADTPEKRYARVRAWVVNQIRQEKE
jgi:hypothetical protein